MSRYLVTVLLAAVVGAAALTWPIPDHGTDDHLPIPASTVIDGHAARWPACQPVRYKLNVAYAPAGAEQDVTDVLADLARHTGLQFEFAGYTSRIPQPDDITAGPMDPDAPLTIAWALRPNGQPVTDATAASHLLSAGGEVAGKAVMVDTYRPRRGLFGARHIIVAGDVVLDAGNRDGQWGGRTGQLAFIQHELAHAVGLDHTDSPDSVMSPTLRPGPYPTYGAADAAALTAIGSPCTP